MESIAHRYKLTQINKTYILTTSVLGDEIKFSVIVEGSNVGFLRTFTIDTLKKIGSVFESIQTPIEAIQWIDNTLKVQKVKIVEDGTMVKLVFFIVENLATHLVEIPITGGESYSTKKNSTSSFKFGVNTNIKANTSSNEKSLSNKIGILDEYNKFGLNEKLSKFNDSNININDDTTVKMRQLMEQNKKLQKEIYNMFAINFMSTAQNINCPMVCKKTDNFKVLEEKLYLDYPELKNKNLVFMANGSVINRYETLENNGIKPGNAIVIYENE